MALLAVGASSFTADFRFQVSKPRDKYSDWVLILRRTEFVLYFFVCNPSPPSILWT
ncbi:unnamed protein product [Meloidogyne enterolobii]|uniref:Uncharacterized protein n=1 Tax=Meloidogyne enterolobii TaxID=390850 RepID=A0ACB0YT49_MELEN